jgi:hypothetical protein
VKGLTMVEQEAIQAAKEYLQGTGPWKLDEIGIGADDYLVRCFAKAIAAAEARGMEKAANVADADAEENRKERKAREGVGKDPEDIGSHYLWAEQTADGIAKTIRAALEAALPPPPEKA